MRIKGYFRAAYIAMLALFPVLGKTQETPELPHVVTKRIVYRDIVIEGAGDDGRPTANLLGLPFVNEFICYGKVEAIEGTRISLKPTEWWRVMESSAPQAFFVETPEGELIDVLSYDGEQSAITLARTLKRFDAENELLKLYRHHTFTSVFGEENLFGFRPGSSTEDADVIFVGPLKAQAALYFSRETGAWVVDGDPEQPADELVLRPHEGIIVLRRDQVPIHLSFQGISEDHLGKVRLVGGLNLVSNMMTLQRRSQKPSRTLANRVSATFLEHQRKVGSGADIQIIRREAGHTNLGRVLTVSDLNLPQNVRITIASDSVIPVKEVGSKGTILNFENIEE